MCSAVFWLIVVKKKMDSPRMEIVSIYFLGIALRSIVSIYSYSGANTPPNFGDYEAQRHWQEITVNLKPQDWYTNSSLNNINYWGLDYPPLTAYHSFVLGSIANKLNESYIELDKSRGFESKMHKSYMRLSVLTVDAFLYLPAIIILILSIANKLHNKHLAHITLFVAVIFPGQILVDNGHFQYNNFSLGLAALAITALVRNCYKSAAMAFTLSLNYKQMELYHSLTIFFYLLRVCFNKKRIFLQFMTFAIIVLGTTICLWLPWVTSFDTICTVIRRLFPVGRGIFEDKVSNFWCSLNVLYKIKSKVSNTVLVWTCFAVTALAIIPINIYVFKKFQIKTFLLGLTTTSMSFFLFSYHVHEKSILLVCLPAFTTFFLLPSETFAFFKLATFSMFPLFVKDNLAVPYFCLLYIFNIAVTEYCICECNILFHHIFKFLNNSTCIILLSLIMLYIPPPMKYLYIWPLLISLYNCISFILIQSLNLFVMVYK